ncbi:hypothetical protein J6590_084611 [Homalodisca vitripennis]|nr:hypothetical protein J6590_084611 [Homalodisca vitripennis]
MAEWSKTLDFESELEIAQTQIKIKIGDSLVEDATEAATEFIRFFASVYVNPTRRQSPVTSLALVPVVEEELEKIIQELSAKKHSTLLTIHNCSIYLNSMASES